MIVLASSAFASCSTKYGLPTRFQFFDFLAPSYQPISQCTLEQNDGRRSSTQMSGLWASRKALRHSGPTKLVRRSMATTPLV